MEEAIKGQHHHNSHRRGQDSFRVETQTDPTVPRLREEGGEATAEPEDPSAELLKRVLAGAREQDVSRVKLARMPAPTGSEGLPPAKEDVGERGSETELVKKVLGQPADLSRQVAADRRRLKVRHPKKQ